jgi:hypothetical protein
VIDPLMTTKNTARAENKGLQFQWDSVKRRKLGMNQATNASTNTNPEAAIKAPNNAGATR